MRQETAFPMEPAAFLDRPPSVFTEGIWCTDLTYCKSCRFLHTTPKRLRIIGASTLHRSTRLGSPNLPIDCFTSIRHSVEHVPSGTRCWAHPYSSMECKFFEIVSSNDIFHVPIPRTGFPSNKTFNFLNSHCTALLFRYMFRHTATSSD